MNYYFILLAVFLMVSNIHIMAQPGYYAWLGKPKSEVISAFGKPHSIENMAHGVVYTYKKQSVTTSYCIENDAVVMVLNQMMFKGKPAALEGAKYLANLCRNDGFSVKTIGAGKYIATSSKRYCKITIAAEQNDYGRWGVSEVAETQ